MATDHSTVELVDADVTRQFARTVLFAALLAVGAWIALPISAVPGTLQMLVVFLVGVSLGPYWGAGAVILYLVTGAIGAPVFAGFTAGLGVLFGPTGGFLWSFPVAALLIGFAVHRGGSLREPSETSIPVLLGSFLVATILVYVAGFVWYAEVVAISYAEAFTVVALPLIPGDLLKMAAAIAIVRSGVIDR